MGMRPVSAYPYKKPIYLALVDLAKSLGINTLILSLHVSLTVKIL